MAHSSENCSNLISWTMWMEYDEAVIQIRIISLIISSSHFLNISYTKENKKIGKIFTTFSLNRNIVPILNLWFPNLSNDATYYTKRSHIYSHSSSCSTNFLSLSQFMFSPFSKKIFVKLNCDAKRENIACWSKMKPLFQESVKLRFGEQ